MSLINLEKYLAKPEVIVSRSPLIDNGDGTWSTTETETLTFTTSQLILLKKAMRAQINDANVNKANGEKQVILDRCTPEYEWVDTAIDDQAEAAFLATDFNPLN